MKSKLVAAPCSEPKSLPYPKLMQLTGTGLVVLFIAPGDGIVVFNGDSLCNIGRHEFDWTMAKFKDLPIGQSVVLENDGGDQ